MRLVDKFGQKAQWVFLLLALFSSVLGSGRVVGDFLGTESGGPFFFFFNLKKESWEEFADKFAFTLRACSLAVSS